MHLYEVSMHEDDSEPVYGRTLGEAHKLAKLSSTRDQVSIVMKDYPINHTTVTGLFNGTIPTGMPLKRWKLSARGGLSEVALDGTEPEPPSGGHPKDWLQSEEQSDANGVPDAKATAFWADLTKPKEKP